jgi:Ca2+:H+ antiporter
MLLGGLRYKEQEFQPIIARVNASSMNLAVVAMLLPTAVNYTSGITPDVVQKLSVAVAIVLIGVYGLTLLFSMKTHTYLYDAKIAQDNLKEIAEENLAEEVPGAPPNPWLWTGVLLAATLFVAIESELLPIVGNAAEHATAVTVAMKDKMDLSVSVAVGSSLQVALFVAPVLVVAGWLLGKPMDLNFNPFELVAVVVAVLITNSISSDGRSNWLEGTLLLATYAVLGLAFYFHPTTPIG